MLGARARVAPVAEEPLAQAHHYGADRVFAHLPDVGSSTGQVGELVRYAAQIAPVALPYLTHRALNMHRFPGGADTKGFWHKQLPDHAPEWLPRWRDLGLEFVTIEEAVRTPAP